MTPMQEVGIPIYGKFKLIPYRQEVVNIPGKSFHLEEAVLIPLEQDFSMFRAKTLFDITDSKEYSIEPWAQGEFFIYGVLFSDYAPHIPTNEHMLKNYLSKNQPEIETKVYINRYFTEFEPWAAFLRMSSHAIPQLSEAKVEETSEGLSNPPKGDFMKRVTESEEPTDNDNLEDVEKVLV